MNRRTLFKLGGLAAVASAVPALTRVRASAQPSPPAPSQEIRISNGLVELAPDRIVWTTTYNGQFPGPLLRFKEGRRAVVDICNDTGIPEQLHWHGQNVPVDVDGAAEEGTPYIPAHGMRRIAFTPGPAGLRFYHTHLRAGADLQHGQYSGQVSRFRWRRWSRCSICVKERATACACATPATISIPCTCIATASS